MLLCITLQKMSVNLMKPRGPLQVREYQFLIHSDSVIEWLKNLKIQFSFEQLWITIVNLAKC